MLNNLKLKKKLTMISCMMGECYIEIQSLNKIEGIFKNKEKLIKLIKLMI